MSAAATIEKYPRITGYFFALLGAGSGLVLWLPIWKRYLEPMGGTKTEWAQVVAGFTDIMIFAGPMLGLLAVAILLGLYQRRASR